MPYLIQCVRWDYNRFCVKYRDFKKSCFSTARFWVIYDIYVHMSADSWTFIQQESRSPLQVLSSKINQPLPGFVNVVRSIKVNVLQRDKVTLLVNLSLLIINKWFTITKLDQILKSLVFVYFSNVCKLCELQIPASSAVTWSFSPLTPVLCWLNVLLCTLRTL